MFRLLRYLLILLFVACDTREQVSYAFYGEKIDTEDAASLEVLLQKVKDKDSLQIKTTGEIVEVCQAKGCWMTLALADGSSMRVTFKDYGFFVPKESVGKKVVIEGVAFNQRTTAEELRHYAQDADKSPEEVASITEPRSEVSFVASGVALAE